MDTRLKLPAGMRKQYLSQVDGLIARFSKVVDLDPSLGVSKFIKTGSLRKGTVLRPRAGNGVDADVAVYIDLEETTRDVLDRLHDRIRRLLIACYPNKNPADFVIQPRTLGIAFRESELDIDLVPILPLQGPGDYGLQPSSRDKSLVKTSVTGQLEFIRAHKVRYPYFTALVRLLKHWRNYKELQDSLRSFTIELIVCYLQEKLGNPASLFDGLLRFYLFLAQDQMTTPITFGRANPSNPGFAGDCVVVIDPVNYDNNVASKITPAECKEISSASEEAWEFLTAGRNNARSGESMAYYRAAFGPSFAIGV